MPDNVGATRFMHCLDARQPRIPLPDAYRCRRVGVNSGFLHMRACARSHARRSLTVCPQGCMAELRPKGESLAPWGLTPKSFSVERAGPHINTHRYIDTNSQHIAVWPRHSHTVAECHTAKCFLNPNSTCCFVLLHRLEWRASSCPPPRTMSCPSLSWIAKRRSPSCPTNTLVCILFRCYFAFVFSRLAPTGCTILQVTSALLLIVFPRAQMTRGGVCELYMFA